MAIRTASVSGDFNGTTTWGGDAVPTASDGFVISTGVTVTVSDARTVDGWTVRGSGVLAIAGTGSLTSTAETLVEGDGTWSDAPRPAKVTVAAGGSLLWAPGAGVTIAHNMGGAAYRHCAIRARGTAGARCTIGKADGSAGTLVARSVHVYTCAMFDCEHADLPGWGGAGVKALHYFIGYNVLVRFVDCTFVDNGVWDLELRLLEAGHECTFRRCRWVGSPDATSLLFSMSGAGLATFDGCHFAGHATFNAGGNPNLVLADCTFRRQLGGNWPG